MNMDHDELITLITTDEFAGQGGSYEIDKNGKRTRIEESSTQPSPVAQLPLKQKTKSESEA
jgi:hypothetical protein